jgi:hypothetical protein
MTFVESQKTEFLNPFSIILMGVPKAKSPFAKTAACSTM